MVAKLSRHARIVHALEVLSSGNSGGFEDTLWLGFGDGWVPLRDRLSARGLIRYNARDDVFVITEQGRRAVATARREGVEAASGSSSLRS